FVWEALLALCSRKTLARELRSLFAEAFSSLDQRDGTNIFCKGCVYTTIHGVDIMVQNKGRNVKKSPSQVDTSPEQVDTTSSQVDTRDLFQGTVLPVWDSVSTRLKGRSTHSGISIT
ncbi:hypothetical protein Taro_008396, partial [Colocasia esculenta]|nr:hypothetical protein [Colocasia esculenta]